MAPQSGSPLPLEALLHFVEAVFLRLQLLLQLRVFLGENAAGLTFFRQQLFQLGDLRIRVPDLRFLRDDLINFFLRCWPGKLY